MRKIKLGQVRESAPTMAETLDRVSKGAIYILVFLLPILFLPWTANVLDFNKQALLIIFVFVALFALIGKSLISGRIKLNLSMIHIAVGVFFLVYLVSTIFSLWRYGSFWGWPQITSESLLSLIGLSLLYFLIVNVFERKEILRLMALLISSACLAMLYGILQLFGKFFIPIGFTRVVSFNTIGTTSILALFAAVLLPLILILITIAKERYLRVLFIVALIITTILLLLINFYLAWWLVMVGSGLVIAFGTQKRDSFDNRWLILPMFFLGLAMLFSFFKFEIPGLPDRPAEVFLNHKTTFNIAKQVLRESPVVGKGPGTFVYSFSKFKDISFNQNLLWSIRFEWGSSKILTMLATVGVLGVLAFLALIGFFIFFGIKFLFLRGREALSKEEVESGGEAGDLSWTLGVGIFISFLVLSISYFLYSSALTLDFIYFLLMGAFVGLLGPIRKEIELKPSSLATLGITFAFTLVFIFGLGVLILEGQRYTSSVSYLKGIKAWQQVQTEQAIEQLERSVKISPGNDFFWREIAQVYLGNISLTAARTDLTREEATRRIQLSIQGAVNAAKAASETNPKNVANWSVRGFVYQSLIGIVGGTKDWALEAYEQAVKLEPTNPYFPTQKGIASLREVGRLAQDKQEQRQELLQEAEQEFKKAIELKADYAPAHFQLAVVYQAQGKVAEMVEQLEETKRIAPFDVGLAFQLGLIYYQRAEYEKARAELERSILLNPNYANALYFLGLTYHELNRNNDAIAVFQRILALNPGHPLAAHILENLQKGNPALKGVTAEEPPVAPIEEKYPEIEE